MIKKIIPFIILTGIIIVGFLGFWYYRDTIFSKEILKLEILGAETAKMGEEIEYTVKYKNNGNFVLEQPKLIFELPENSLTEDSRLRLTQELKDIYPGDENFVQFKTRLLGKENDLKVARAWLSYKPKELSVRYEGNTTFTTKINTVPITLGFDLPSKAEKGKDIAYAINYFSNIDYPLENLSVKVDSVPGFNFISSDPLSLDHAEWKLDTLQKSQGGRINIKGALIADTGSHLNFSAKLGMWQDGSFVVIKEASQDVEVIQPLLFISQKINGSAQYIASPGEQLHYEIFLRNIGATSFDNLFVISRIDGAAFDLSTVRSDEGKVKANDNLIVWDAKQIPRLQSLPPNQEAKVEFTVTLKDAWPISEAEKNNAFITNKVNVSDISEAFVTKVNSNLSLTQKAYYAPQQGIENSGPIPPRVNQTTTYTIIWQIKNYFNDVKNVKIKAILPQGVTLSDALFPEDQASHFSLDSISREIVWLAGNYSGGSSISLMFQVALTPSPQQQGNVAELIGSASISGEDQSTGKVITAAAPALTTSLPDDPSNSGGGIVQ